MLPLVEFPDFLCRGLPEMPIMSDECHTADRIDGRRRRLLLLTRPRLFIASAVLSPQSGEPSGFFGRL